MRLRPPSFGFVYLVLAAAAFVAFLAYLADKPWFEQRGRGHDLAEAAYLRRIAARGTAEQRARWLADALRKLIAHGQWDDVFDVVLDCDRHAVPLDDTGVLAIDPGRCWAVGLDAESAIRGADPAVLLLRNPDDRLRTVRLHWSADRPGTARHRRVGTAAWTSFKLERGGDGTSRGVVSCEVPSDARLLLEFAAASPADGPDPERSPTRIRLAQSEDSR